MLEKVLLSIDVRKKDLELYGVTCGCSGKLGKKWEKFDEELFLIKESLVQDLSKNFGVDFSKHKKHDFKLYKSKINIYLEMMNGNTNY